MLKFYILVKKSPYFVGTNQGICTTIGDTYAGTVFNNEFTWSHNLCPHPSNGFILNFVNYT